jgi:hypothetical protein
MFIVNDIVENNTTKAIAKDIILWNTCFISMYKGKNILGLNDNILLI